MFKDALVRLSVLGWGSIPGSLPVLLAGFFIGSESRKVALDVSARPTKKELVSR